ncbi:EAL domain-containing protein [Shewanella avicenniae]|uniref:EAL domain-containing protein n=1 Tax=Shewanella avicenniae TaxID=2814294 RepID=A0ABX7QMY2_9GAMM|nr:EAL domain-containing protein [Shewanella avicenniae]QSX32120.1 EAL domain-containing protein [Shewanella avicenniae]
MLGKGLNIRAKFFAICTLSICICVAMVLLIAAREHKLSYSELAENSLVATTENFADDLLLTMSESEDSFFIRTQLLKFEKFSYVRSVVVYSPTGEIKEKYIAASVFDNEDMLQLPHFERLSINERIQHFKNSDSVICTRAIGEPNAPIGYVSVESNISKPVAESLTQLVVSALPTSVLILVLALLATYFSFESLLKPLMALVNFTKKVSRSNDYSLQCEVEGRDEVAMLGHAMNDMMDTINTETQRNLQQQAQLKEQKDAMHQLANYDQLTGLVNRRQLMELLDRRINIAKNDSSDFAVIFFDLDDFKSINDHMGHDVGDKLLIGVTEAVLGNLNRGDILGRLGGDEFLLITALGTNAQEVRSLVERIYQTFENSLRIDQWDIHTGLSMGVVFASAANYNRDNIISYADIAMYEAKRLGKGTHKIFEPSMLDDNMRRIQIVGLIPFALEYDEFSMVYQLKIGRNGRIRGIEGLLRWHSPDLGFVSPAEFIPIAESGGKIGDITRWVIKRVISDLAELKKICGDDILVSLNVSSEDLKNPLLEEIINEQLDHHGQSIKNLQFEMTESSYLDDLSSANGFFKKIRDLGGSVALDDFGTGYSSLSCLTEIELDTLKIDRQFIINSIKTQKDRAVLSAILAMARAIGLKTCSEGIETTEQAHYLLEQGCDEMQGYYFAKPVPLDQLELACHRAEESFAKLFDSPTSFGISSNDSDAAKLLIPHKH